MTQINPIPFPAIQGVRTDHSSLQFMINGVEIIPGAGNQMKYGLRSWTWKSGLAPQALEGAAAQPVGWTRGKYSGEGEMEWWRADADNLEAFLMNSSGGDQGLYEISVPDDGIYQRAVASATEHDCMLGANRKSDRANRRTARTRRNTRFFTRS